jgi:hypothetical protein
VNRDHKSFEWFIDLLAKLEAQQSMSHFERFIEIKLFVSGVKKTDKLIENYPMQYYGDKEKSKIEEEIIRNLFKNIEPGRPDFDKLFTEISSKKNGKVHVFFCGNNQLGKIVNKKCRKYKFNFSREYF